MIRRRALPAVGGVLLACATSFPVDARSAAQGITTEPQPRGDAASWFPGEDYPAAAAAIGQQGRVVVRASVNVSGIVTGCSVVESSGVPSLDGITCDDLLKNGAFSPALDERGRVVAGSTDIPVRWVLPPSERPRRSEDRVVVADISRDNRLLSCSTMSDGAPVDESDCAMFNQGAEYLRRLKGSLAERRVRVVAQTIFQFAHDPAIAERYRQKGMVLLGLGRATLTIGPDGEPSGCTLTESRGQMGSLGVCNPQMAGRYIATAGRTDKLSLLSTIFVQPLG